MSKSNPIPIKFHIIASGPVTQLYSHLNSELMLICSLIFHASVLMTAGDALSVFMRPHVISQLFSLPPLLSLHLIAPEQERHSSQGIGSWFHTTFSMVVRPNSVYLYFWTKYWPSCRKRLFSFHRVSITSTFPRKNKMRKEKGFISPSRRLLLISGDRLWCNQDICTSFG